MGRAEAAVSGLIGQRVLVTRAAEDCAPWASRLANAGAVPLMMPCIECQPIRDPAARSRMAAALPATDWLVLTSRRGADALRAWISASESDRAAAARLPDLLIAAVGPTTADAARGLPGRVELVAPDGTAASLAQALAARLDAESASRQKPPRILIAVAENAGPILEETLGRAGGVCLRINVYRTVPTAPPVQKQTLSELGADKILLASPSAVTGLVNLVEFDTTAEILTIGPSTSRAARAASLTVTAEAPQPSLEGLLEIMQ